MPGPRRFPAAGLPARPGEAGVEWGADLGLTGPGGEGHITKPYGRYEDKPGLRLDGVSYQLQWDDVPDVAEPEVAIARVAITT
jgi:hypothetical protein